jgi:hypothetical protein
MIDVIALKWAAELQARNRTRSPSVRAEARTAIDPNWIRAVAVAFCGLFWAAVTLAIVL